MSLVWHSGERAEGQHWLQASTLPDLSSVTARVTSIVTLNLRASSWAVPGSSLSIHLYLSSAVKSHTAETLCCCPQIFFEKCVLHSGMKNFNSTFLIKQSTLLLQNNFPILPLLHAAQYSFLYLMFLLYSRHLIRHDLVYCTMEGMSTCKHVMSSLSMHSAPLLQHITHIWQSDQHLVAVNPVRCKFLLLK